MPRPIGGGCLQGGGWLPQNSWRSPSPVPTAEVFCPRGWAHTLDKTVIRRPWLNLSTSTPAAAFTPPPATPQDAGLAAHLRTLEACECVLPLPVEILRECLYQPGGAGSLDSLSCMDRQVCIYTLRVPFTPDMPIPLRRPSPAHFQRRPCAKATWLRTSHISYSRPISGSCCSLAI